MMNPNWMNDRICLEAIQSQKMTELKLSVTREHGVDRPSNYRPCSVGQLNDWCQQSVTQTLKYLLIYM